MRKIILTLSLIIAVGLAAWAAEPGANLTQIEKEYSGLNLVNQDVAPPPQQASGAVDNITWVALPNAPNNVYRAACAKLGNYVYVFGGLAASSAAIAFNITTEQWEQSTAPTVTGFNWNAVATDSVIYLFPKSFGNGEIQKFTPNPTGAGGTWTLAALYPLNANAFAVAWDGGNYIYCAGNSGSSPYGPQAYRMNLTDNTFEQLAPLPEGRGWIGGAWVNGKFYAVAGSNPSYQYTNTCYEYNPQTNTWATKAPMILATSFTCFNTTTDGQLIYVVGGGGGNAASLPATDTVQVYDPATDTWSLETNRMNNYGTNSACWVEEGNWIIDVGGKDLVASYNCAWKGNLMGGQPSIIVTLTPHNPPIIIPASGGSFQYDVEIENTTTFPITFDGWIKAILPNGTGYLILLRYAITLAGGDTLARPDLSQTVPANAPAGNYAYGAYVGTWPSTVMASDTIYFQKLAGDGYAGSMGQWNLSGWEEVTSSISSAPAQYALLSASPNPFNPTTLLSYELRDASFVNLSVFDVAGRQVAELVNGWKNAGSHEAVFDGSKLASGVYLCRLQAGNFTDSEKLVLMK